MFEQYIKDNIPTPDSDVGRQLALQVSGGANWFYWIAGLSIVNSIVNLYQGSWGFAAGLGINKLLDALSAATATDGGINLGQVILLVLGIMIAGFFFIFGVLANRKQTWAFVLGIIMYTLDGVILVFIDDLLGIIIHLLAIIFLVRGYLALRKLLRAESA